MRVFALVSDCFGSGGGIARYNQALMTALGVCDTISAITILPRFGATTAALPDGIVQQPPAAGKFAWAARALTSMAREKFDLVFCGHLNAVVLAAAIARGRRVPLWVQVHGIEAWEPRGRLVCAGLEAATMVTSVSRFTRRRLLAWSDILPDRVRVLPNTFTANFAPRLRSPALAERLGLDGKRVILTVGRLAATERYKGHDRIIRIMPKVLRQVPEAAYLIVGTGDDRPRLEQLAVGLGIANIVKFAEGVSEIELSDHLAIADLFAMPSTGEGFGIVFLEAAAAGLPVIGGNIDGSRDALADGVIGNLVDPEDGAQLANAIIVALQKRQSFQPDAISRFAMSNFASHVDELVRSLAR